MNIEEIKSSLVSLSPREQAEVTAFLFQLRHAADAEYQDRVSSRLCDPDESHWLKPEDFERELDES